MKTKTRLLITALLAASHVLCFAQATNGVADSVVSTTTNNEVVPLITIDDAPLPDAIRTLARQAEINFQFDPDVINPPPDASGKTPVPPTVSFRWENVTAMDALTAILENNKLQLVRDPKTKIARITKKDTAAQEPLVTKVFQLEYSNPSNLVAILTSTISPRSHVNPDPRTSQLIISATENDLDSVEALIKKLDAQTRQILIEARFLEISKKPKTSKGIDWTDTLNAQRVTFGNTSQVLPSGTLPGSPAVIASTANGFGPVGFLNAQGASVVLSFLNSDADTKSIATPRAVTLDNVQTELSVVRNVPVFEQEQGSTSGGAQQASTVKPNYMLPGPNGTILNEVGIKLLVTPRVSGSSNVFLDLKPEISDQEPEPERAVLNDQKSEAPVFSRRKIQTQVMVPSGFTLVLGGLRQDNSSKSFAKVPFFGDLPGIGLLFRKDEKSRVNNDIVIFVTPTIIQNDDFQKQENPSEFLRQKMENDKTDEEWSAWDSGKPVNWSKSGSGREEASNPKKGNTPW